MKENEISNVVIGCAIRVHSALGPGLLEAPYAACLHYEIVKSGLFVEAQKPLPLVYEMVRMECGYRMDLLVERSVVLEIKAVEALRSSSRPITDLPQTVRLPPRTTDELQSSAFERWD